jgi:hypothetical protein
MGSKPSASPKGFGRSPTIAFPGAVKTFTLRVVSFTPFVPSIWYSFRCHSELPAVPGEDRQKLADEAQSSASYPRRALTVGEIGTLSDFDNVTVRIADVAANLAVLGDRLGDELGASTFP